MKMGKEVGEIFLTAAICAVFCFLCIYAQGPREYVDRAGVRKAESAIDLAKTAVGEEWIDGKINIATAGVETLKELYGVGDAIAVQIVDKRIEEPFRSVEDIMKVSGIGYERFNKFRDSITLG